MGKEYFKLDKPKGIFPVNNDLLKKLDDEFWKNWIFYHLLNFYNRDDKKEIKKIIAQKGKVEDNIAKYIRNQIRRNEKYCVFGQQGFLIEGGINNDLEKEGEYDISIFHSYWQNRNGVKGAFHFECKNLTLNSKHNHISKYVYYNDKECGVYRYFNGKYAQDQNFGGMIGFVLDGDVSSIIEKLIFKMKAPFDLSPEGDLTEIKRDSIEGYSFTFNSTHKRKGKEFLLHHLLLDFS